ncbi:glycosyltransferase family 2 protein [Aequorivita sp. 609]|uniref:glycosyltransferase family 2 protein n=1 Tax=Aequorivita TaxID=153265 RepID=UPI00160EA439|nr:MULTISPECIES: glycosyltransferase family 2 protein [Aequorivita]MBB6681534.1 glycosyltransferase family 2 protein [Aequorivita sp. 609]
MSKISIILPCYNVEKYIAKSIQSILDQTYDDFEILVIIDGSPDNSKAIAESIKDPRIKIYEKPNGGLSDARNYGLERANGKFIYFLDPDDWIEPNLLEDNLAIIEQKQLDFVVFGYFQDNFGYSENLISTIEYIPKVSAYYTDQDEPKIDIYHVGLLGYAWNKIYRKSFLDKNNFIFPKGITLVEDILFNAPIYTNSNAIYFNQQAYYHYISRTTESEMKKFHPDFIELREMKFQAIEKWLVTWNVYNKKEILVNLVIGGLRGAIQNIFTSKNNLSFFDKYKLTKSLFKNPETKGYIENYKTKNLKDKTFKFLVKHNMAFTTSFIAEFIK